MKLALVSRLNSSPGTKHEMAKKMELLLRSWIDIDTYGVGGGHDLSLLAVIWGIQQ
jgi:hypothetical protein